jgi:hypothetical protein
MRNPITRNAAFFLVGGFAAALFIAGTAHAITDTIFKYSAPKTGYLPVPAAAFGPANSSGQYNFENEAEYARPATNNETCFKAPVNLPQGATMSVFSLWYATDGGTGIVRLFRAGDTGGLDQLFSKPIPDNGDLNSRAVITTKTFGGAMATIDNRAYSYWLFTCLTNGMDSIILSARITYTYSTAGD